jgi:hypothetical protein
MTTRRFVGSLWLGSVIIGLALLLGLSPQQRVMFFAIAVCLETGHTIAPIALAWSNAGFRQVMLQRKRKFVLLPILLIVAPMAIGIATALGWTTYQPGRYHSPHITDLTNPLPILAWIYIIWNLYHTGMQNFGVLRLWRTTSFPRYLDMAACLIATILAMSLSKLVQGDLVLAIAGAVAFNHWAVSLGLCGRVSGRPWLFMPAILLSGMIGFSWFVPTARGLLVPVVPMVLCARIGLSFAHFLYDRWVWKFSDPQVRSTIGRSLETAT